MNAKLTLAGVASVLLAVVVVSTATEPPPVVKGRPGEARSTPAEAIAAAPAAAVERATPPGEGQLPVFLDDTLRTAITRSESCRLIVLDGDDGRPIPGARAIERRRGDDLVPIADGAPTDGEGTVDLAVGNGPLALIVRADGYLPTPIEVTAAMSPVEVRLERGLGIEGRLSATDGELPRRAFIAATPIRRVDGDPTFPDVTARSRVTAVAMDPTLVAQQTEAGPDGTFLLRGLPPGEYGITVEADGYEVEGGRWPARVVTVPCPFVELHVRPSARLEVQVRGADGPLDDAVVLLEFDPESSDGLLYFPGSPAGAGVFRFGDEGAIPEGRFRAKVLAFGHHAALSPKIDVVGARATPAKIDVTLQEAPSLRLTPIMGRQPVPVEQVRVAAVRVDGGDWRLSEEGFLGDFHLRHHAGDIEVRCVVKGMRRADADVMSPVGETIVEWSPATAHEQTKSCLLSGSPTSSAWSRSSTWASPAR